MNSVGLNQLMCLSVTSVHVPARDVTSNITTSFIYIVTGAPFTMLPTLGSASVLFENCKILKVKCSNESTIADPVGGKGRGHAPQPCKNKSLKK